MSEPLLGDRIELPSADLWGRPIRLGDRNQRLLLAYLAHCSTCRKDSIAPELLPFPKFDKVVIVHSDHDVLQKLRTKLPENAVLIADPEGKLGRSLNAFPAPRYYLISGDLRLLALQETPGRIPDFLQIEEPEL